MAVVTPPARIGKFAAMAAPLQKRAKPRRKPRKLPVPKLATKPKGLINR